MRNLGLVGGLGPGATAHYYRELAKAEPGELLLIHADADRVLDNVRRGDRLALASYLARLIERLAAGGAQLAAISAITPHICIRELEKISVLPLVNIIDTLNGEIAARGYKKIALFGTSFVMESRMFGMLEQVEVIVPEHIETIHRTYMEIVNGGTEGRDILSQIAKELPVDAVLLAGTDLSVVFDESNTTFPHLDCAAVHIQSILGRLQ